MHMPASCPICHQKDNNITRHMLGLANGMRGARLFRQILSVEACKRGAGPEVIRRAWDAIADQGELVAA